MSHDNNADRALVQRYLELSSSGRVKEAFELVADDASFWISGRLVVSGQKSRERVMAIGESTMGAFPDGYDFRIRNIVAEGGHVALEASGEGIRHDGFHYQVDYAMFFEVGDGLIRSIHEYLDTEYVATSFDIPLRK